MTTEELLKVIKVKKPEEEIQFTDKQREDLIRAFKVEVINTLGNNYQYDKNNDTYEITLKDGTVYTLEFGSEPSNSIDATTSSNYTEVPYVLIKNKNTGDVINKFFASTEIIDTYELKKSDNGSINSEIFNNFAAELKKKRKESNQLIQLIAEKTGQSLDDLLDMKRSEINNLIKKFFEEHQIDEASINEAINGNWNNLFDNIRNCK